jgi:WD40 repeat protein
VGDGATRVWDLERELCVARVAAAEGGHGVSALCTDPSGGPLLGVGYGSGAVQIWDRRVPMALHAVASLSLHQGHAVTQLCMKPGSEGRVLVSSSAGGAVKLCDVRAAGIPLDLYHSPNVAAVAVHKEQPVLAVGSRRQLLKLYHLGTKKRITIKARPYACHAHSALRTHTHAHTHAPWMQHADADVDVDVDADVMAAYTKAASNTQAHSDFWGSRLGPISALRFHPTQQLLATGAANDHLSVFSYEASSWTAVM